MPATLTPEWLNQEDTKWQENPNAPQSTSDNSAHIVYDGTIPPIAATLIGLSLRLIEHLDLRIASLHMPAPAAELLESDMSLPRPILQRRRR